MKLNRNIKVLNLKFVNQNYQVAKQILQVLKLNYKNAIQFSQANKNALIGQLQVRELNLILLNLGVIPIVMFQELLN